MLPGCIHVLPVRIFSMAVYWQYIFPEAPPTRQAEGDEFYIDLDALPRIRYLFVRLRDIFWAGRFFYYDTLPFQDASEVRAFAAA